MSAGTDRRTFRLAESDWLASQHRVRTAYGAKGEISRIIRGALAIYRRLPVSLERRLIARARTEGRPVADLVVDALARYLDEADRELEQQKAPPSTEDDGTDREHLDRGEPPGLG